MLPPLYVAHPALTHFFCPVGLIHSPMWVNFHSLTYPNFEKCGEREKRLHPGQLQKHVQNCEILHVCFLMQTCCDDGGCFWFGIRGVDFIS